MISIHQFRGETKLRGNPSNIYVKLPVVLRITSLGIIRIHLPIQPCLKVSLVVNKAENYSGVDYFLMSFSAALIGSRIRTPRRAHGQQVEREGRYTNRRDLFP